MGKKGQRERNKECHRAAMIVILHMVMREGMSLCNVNRGNSLCEGLSQEVAEAECQREGKSKSHGVSQVSARTLDLTLCEGEGKPVEGFVEQRNDDASYVTCILEGIIVAAVLSTALENQGRERRDQ